MTGSSGVPMAARAGFSSDSHLSSVAARTGTRLSAAAETAATPHPDVRCVNLHRNPQWTSRVSQSAPQVMAARLLFFAVLLPVLPFAPLQALPPGGQALEICLLTPSARVETSGLVRAVTPVAEPTIFARGQFEEIRLERGEQRLWSRQASAIEPIAGPIAWPLAALRPGERLWLRLRPLGAGPADFASIELIGGGAAAMERGARLRRSLGRDPGAWLRAVNMALQDSQPEEALALLFDFRGPSSPELDALRQQVHDQACGSAIVLPDPASR